MGMRINTTLPLPAELKAEYPLSKELTEIKKKRDAEIRDIFTGKSDKFVVIVGPCSADNEDSVCEYISRLAKVNEKVSDRLMIIPRIYTNKPRTTGEGYKGMLHQPKPDQAPDLLAGIIAIRKMHIRAIEESGLTSADEMLYPENRSFIITDSHQMASITDHYAPGEAAVKALQAGVDMILMPQDLQAAFDGVKHALSDGTLTQARIDESVLRILQVKAEYNILQ